MPAADANEAPDAAFPSTAWSRVLGAGAAGPDWDALARTYWKPVAAWLRARWSLTPEDAADATQDFFLFLLEGGLVAAADPEKGRFRALLKTALGRFAVDRWRRAAAARAGGGRRVLAFGIHEDGVPQPAASGLTPEEAFDHAWRAAAIESALEEVGRELAAEGRGITWNVFRDYFLAPGEPDYSALAATYATTVANVSNHLKAAKARFRARLRARVAETVASSSELEAEWAWLLPKAAP